MRCLIPLAVLLVGLSWMAGTAGAQGGSIAPGGPNLKTTLEKGLKARRPEEFAFIALVVAKVEERTLPRPLVESTFLWARGKRPFPTVYFERGLRVRAKRLGIAL